MTRTTTRARFGVYSYYVQPNTNYDGMSLTLGTLTSAVHYVSLYVYTDSSGTPEVALDGKSWTAASVIGGMTGGWVRYGVAIPAAQASGSTRLDIRLNAGADFYVDAVQVEANDYGTTYIDGDRGTLYRWSGLRHGSTSTRSAQERSGGRERNLSDDYSVNVVEGTRQIGAPPFAHSMLGQALLPGAVYQGYNILPREIELHFHYAVEDAGTAALTWAAFHAKRNELFNLLKPGAVRGAQPVVIGYAGAGTGKKLYASFYYAGGLEFGEFMAHDEVAKVRLLAPDPFWYEDNKETAVLDFADDVTSAYALGRINGQWQAFGSGFNDVVRAIAVDTQRGRVYFGGSFTTANGVSCNRICYWDGTTFQRMGNGIGNNYVKTIAIAPNGDVWVGGLFTVVDGSASQNHIARWNVATSTWTSFSTMANNEVFDIEILPNGIVYACGWFTNFNSDADADYIVSYDGDTWSPLGTGLNDNAYGLASDSLGNVYVGGEFTTANGVTVAKIAYWNGTTFVAMGSGLTGGDCFWVARGPDDSIYAGGDFTAAGGNSISYLARWNGVAWSGMGEAPDTSGVGIFTAPNNLIFVAGTFTSIGGIDVTDNIAAWNGYSWFPLDIDVPGSGVSYIAFRDEDYYMTTTTSGTATVAGLTSVTPTSSADSYPVVTIINGNSSGSCTLRWLENQSTGDRLYFNLAVQPGETVTVDLRPEQKFVWTDWGNQEITDQPLDGSDFADFKLLPARADGAAANTIACFISGTVTSVVVVMHWLPVHLSVDGAA